MKTLKQYHYMNLNDAITIELIEDVFLKEPCFAPSHECIRDAKVAIEYLNNKSIDYILDYEPNIGIDIIIDNPNCENTYFHFRYLNNNKKFYWVLDNVNGKQLANFSSLEEFYVYYQNLIFQ